MVMYRKNTSVLSAMKKAGGMWKTARWILVMTASQKTTTVGGILKMAK